MSLTTPAAADFDSPWKDALEEYLQEFFALCFPQAHTAIDWRRPYTFLDNELRQAVREAAIGRRVVDRLARVWLLDGQDVWVLVHIEVQSQPEHGFAKRMFVYYYRLFDRYDREVVSLAVLADEQTNWRPASYALGRWGCAVRFDYPVIKLLDWRVRRGELEASDNPFAVVILAHLAAQEMRQDMVGRQGAKLALVRRLYERGYSRERVISLFRFIDWLLVLPEERELQILQAIGAIEEEQQVAYVTSIERIGQDRGRVEGKRLALRRFVEHRFGRLSEALEQRLAAADEATLDQMLDRVIDVPSADAP